MVRCSPRRQHRPQHRNASISSHTQRPQVAASPAGRPRGRFAAPSAIDAAPAPAAAAASSRGSSVGSGRGCLRGLPRFLGSGGGPAAAAGGHRRTPLAGVTPSLGGGRGCLRGLPGLRLIGTASLPKSWACMTGSRARLHVPGRCCGARQQCQERVLSSRYDELMPLHRGGVDLLPAMPPQAHRPCSIAWTSQRCLQSIQLLPRCCPHLFSPTCRLQPPSWRRCHQL